VKSQRVRQALVVRFVCGSHLQSSPREHFLVHVLITSCVETCRETEGVAGLVPEHALMWGRMMEPLMRFTVLSTLTLTLFLFAIVTADVVTHHGAPGAAFEFVSVVSALMPSHAKQ
jgi:hypothetical protein